MASGLEILGGLGGGVAGAFAGGPVGAAAGYAAGSGLGKGANDYFWPQQPAAPTQDQLRGQEQARWVQDQLRQQAMNAQENGYNQNGYQAREDLARRNFREQGIPDIMERFAGLNAQRSSAFPGAIAGARGNLEAQLDAMREQYHERQQQRLGAENLERMGLLGGLAQNQARGGIEERLANLRERQQEGFEGQNHIGNIFNLLNLLGGLQNEQGRQQQGNAQETYAADVGRQRNYNPPQAQENVGRAGTNPVF